MAGGWQVGRDLNRGSRPGSRRSGRRRYVAETTSLAQRGPDISGLCHVCMLHQCAQPTVGRVRGSTRSRGHVRKRAHAAGQGMG